MDKFRVKFKKKKDFKEFSGKPSINPLKLWKKFFFF